ncbi:MAG: efflux RND transporter periplasmic adaptor subunit [Devosia sp.]
MEQDKIDLAHATPVSGPDLSVSPPRRRGTPIWLQLILSLIVLAIAAAIAGLLLPTANTMLARFGVELPLLTAQADAPATPAPATGAAPQRQGAQGQAGVQGQAGGRPAGGFAGARTAVVVTQPVTTATINTSLAAIGEGVAVKAVTVNPSSSGTLLTVAVKPGDRVEDGARLATLDSGTQQVAFDKATLASRDADAGLARAQSLAKTNNLSDSQLAAAQLAADQAKLALTDASLALQQRTITTPIGGTVGLIQVTPGNSVGTQTVVTTVQDSSDILVNFWVPERYSSQISSGQAVSAESSALPGKSFSGTVTAIDNQIDPASRTLQVQATIPNPDGIIKAGMSFNVDLNFAGESFTAVDPLSIQWSTQGAYVWKVVDAKAVKGMVEIIQRNSDGVLVKGDVKPGDQVVTQGVLQLTDNLAVRLLDQAGGQGGQQAAGAGQGGSPSPDAHSASRPPRTASSAAGG